MTDPTRFPGPIDVAGSVVLTAQLGIDGSGKLGMIAGYNVKAIAEFLIAPGVRAWRLTTGLEYVPQCATLAITSDPAAPFAMPCTWATAPGPPAPIVLDVYLRTAAGLIDPAAAFVGGGFVYLTVRPGGTLELVAP